MKSDTSKFLIGFAIGAIGGVVAGILLAPDSGKATRRRIVEKSGKLKKDLAEFADAAKESIADTVDEYWKGTKPKSGVTYKR